jgi:hypothetical protein
MTKDARRIAETLLGMSIVRKSEQAATARQSGNTTKMIAWVTMLSF